MANNQESAETRVYRHMQIEQGHLYKEYHCDLCNGFATQTHELIYRSQTVNNEEARRLSFQKELLAQLCERCHTKAHTETTTLALLHRNIAVYGYDNVADALALLQAELKGVITLIMPKKEVVNE